MRKLGAVALLVAGLLFLMAGCSKPATAPLTSAPAKQQMVNVTTADLLGKIKAGEKPLIVDVRTPEEYAAGHIDGARLIPLQTIDQGISAIGKDQEIYLICHSGNRSAQAYQILASRGYTRLKNVVGGMASWEQIGGPITK